MSEKITFHQIRKEYADQGINDSELPAEPMALFRQWYQAAEDNQPDDWVEANAMSLATSDVSGRVSNRYVLMKGVDDNGIRFYTNYDSDKAQQIASNPHASAAFHWAYLGRQIRVEGRVEKTSREDSERYFHSRPRGSQIGAVASAQSAELKNREQLEQNKIQFEAEFEGRPIPLPENWGGFRIVANRIEFWQGRANRMHDRVVFELAEDGSWKRFRVSP